MLRINGKSMAVKDIRTKIKYGVTPQELADFFEVSEIEFMQNLKNRLGQTFPEYERELRKNKKRRVQSLRKKTVPTVATEEEEMQKVGAEELIESSEAEIENEEEVLQEKLLIIKASIEKEYARYRKAEADTAGVDTTIESVRRKLADICKAVKSYEEDLENLAKERNVFIEDRKAAYEEIKRLEAEHKKVEAELQAFRVVKISFTNEGVSVSEGGFEPSEEDIESKYLELSKMEAMDDYSVKQVRIAAKTFCIVELLEVMEMKYSIIHDEWSAPIREVIEIAQMNNPKLF